MLKALGVDDGDLLAKSDATDGVKELGPVAIADLERVRLAGDDERRRWRDLALVGGAPGFKEPLRSARVMGNVPVRTTRWPSASRGNEQA